MKAGKPKKQKETYSFLQANYTFLKFEAKNPLDYSYQSLWISSILPLTPSRV